MGDEIITSGNYRQGYCYCEGNLNAGEYTVILSSYDLLSPPFSPYIITVSSYLKNNSENSQNGFQLYSIPPEGAGMELVSLTSRFCYSSGTAAGCTNYQRYHFNPSYLVQVSILILYHICISYLYP